MKRSREARHPQRDSRERPRTITARSRGQPSPTIDELPLEWFFSDGFVVDVSDKMDGDKIDAHDFRAALDRMDYEIKPLDIVLVRTGRDRFYGERDYAFRGCAVTAEATRWLYDQGVRVMGIDAWGWTARSTGRHRTHLQAAGAAFPGLRTRRILRIRRSNGELPPCRSRASRWRASPSRSHAAAPYLCGGGDPGRCAEAS